MLKPVPYIGITGVMNRPQIATIGASALNLLHKTGRKIMIGVLASSKTLTGEQNKYPRLYPPIKSLPEIFASDPRLLNIVHYNTDNPLLLRDELFKTMRLFKERGNGLNGFQLNMPWPSISHLEDVKTTFPKLKIILQIGPKAFEQVGYSPGAVMEGVGWYLPFIDYILLDPSDGLGKPLSAETLRPYLQELANNLHTIGLGVAGGLGPDTMHLAEPLIKEFPNLSIDAQSGLQEKGALSVNKSVEYIRRALQMYKKYE